MEREWKRERERESESVKISNVPRVWLDAIQIILLVRKKVRDVWCKEEEEKKKKTVRFVMKKKKIDAVN